MSKSWTISELVGQVADRIAALPAPKNGQVRAVPDERTIRYYATIGLLDRPIASRGRTSLYGARHLAQVVAIKRLQAMGKSLADIQGIWPTLDDLTLARMSGVRVDAVDRPVTRAGFWKRDAVAAPSMAEPAPRAASPAAAAAVEAHAPAELRLQLAANVSVTIALADDTTALTLSPADVRALRAAAAPLAAELARRQLIPHVGKEEP